MKRKTSVRRLGSPANPRGEIMLTPPLARVQILDKGQRYEVRCKDPYGQSVLLGWSDDTEAFLSNVDQHPEWHSRYIVDRRPEVKR